MKKKQDSKRNRRKIRDGQMVQRLAEKAVEIQKQAALEAAAPLLGN